MHPGLDGGHLDPQHRRYHAVRKPFDVVQQKDRPVAGRELVDGRAKHGLQLGLEGRILQSRRPVAIRVNVRAGLLEGGTKIVP